jgi:hypothetical protein
MSQQRKAMCKAPEQVGKQLARKMVEMGAIDCISELKPG